MQELKGWQDELLSQLGQRIRRYDFEERPNRHSFSKKTQFGRIELHLAFITHDVDFDVTADVGIRFDQVEDLVNADDKLLTKSEKLETFTIGSELGNIADGRQKRWTVASAVDISDVADSIFVTFETIGLPYIERLSVPTRALEVLSGDGPDSWLHCPLHGIRAKRAVGIALLTGGIEAARQLAKTKLVFLEQRQDFGLASFHAFMSRIEMAQYPVDTVDECCPVCGYSLGFEPWKGALPSDEICSCCGMQFGYYDATPLGIAGRLAIYREWRKRWVDEGMLWNDETPPPKDWNPTEQLSHAIPLS